MFKQVLIILITLSISSLSCAKEARKGFFWAVKSKKATVYLLGSIHVGKKSMYPLPKHIEEAYKQSDIIVTETDFKEGSDMSVASKLLYPKDKTIADHISPESLKRLKEHLEKQGLPYMMFKQFKAWYTAFMIQYTAYEKAGYSLQWGIDHYFYNKALQDQKGVDAIESVLDIDALFSSFSDEVNEKLLNYFIDDTNELEKTINDLYQYWNKNDLRGLENYIQKYINEQKELVPVFEKLIYERNDKMVKKINEYLKTDKTYFVIIGSGHYSGKRGIIKQLKDQGVTFTNK